MEEKALFKHPQQRMQMDVLSSLAADNMRDRKYIVCFFRSQLELTVQRLSENNFAICKLKECDMEVNEEE